jgi:hypothetical protein
MGKSQRKSLQCIPTYLPTYSNLPSPHNLHPPKLRNKIPQQETLTLSSSERRKEKENTPKTPYYKQQLRLPPSIPAALPCNQRLI